MNVSAKITHIKLAHIWGGCFALVSTAIKLAKTVLIILFHLMHALVALLLNIGLWILLLALVHARKVFYFIYIFIFVLINIF